MQYKAHATAGLATGLVAAPLLAAVIPSDTPSSILFAGVIATSMIGSLFPDIDHRGSYLGRRLPILSFILNKSLGHRGATHSPLVLTVFAAVLLVLLRTFAPAEFVGLGLAAIAGFLLGSFSHVLLDMLTPSGVPVYYPFSKKKVRIAKIPTGGFGETLFTAGLFVFCVWMGVQQVLAL